MSRGDARFLQELEARRGQARRVSLELLWRALEAARPELAHHPAARAELGELLSRLAARGALRLPKGRHLYDQSQAPALPRWAELAAPARVPTAAESARGVRWHPALEFVASLPSLGEAELRDLLAVQRFLGAGADAEPVLTVRERSLRLFGDDKRLERLARGQLFGAGRLSLALLRCREARIPFVSRDFGAGDGALIIENKDSYLSACAARARLGARSRWRWLAFGSGNAILQTAPSLADWRERPARLAYFGDVDRAGLEVAVQLASLTAEHALPIAACAAGLYARLAQRARELCLRLAGGAPCALGEEARRWLPPELHSSVGEVLARGERWPQEAVVEADFVELLGLD